MCTNLCVCVFVGGISATLRTRFWPQKLLKLQTLVSEGSPNKPQRSIDDLRLYVCICVGMCVRMCVCVCLQEMASMTQCWPHDISKIDYVNKTIILGCLVMSYRFFSFKFRS